MLQLRELRDRFVADGEQTMRSILRPVVDGARHEALVLMLCGDTIHSVSLHGRAPSEELIDAAHERSSDAGHGDGCPGGRT